MSASDDFKFASGDSEKLKFCIASEGSHSPPNLNQNGQKCANLNENGQKCANENAHLPKASLIKEQFKSQVSQNGPKSAEETLPSYDCQEIEIYNFQKDTQDTEKLPKLSQTTSSLDENNQKLLKEFDETSHTYNGEETSKTLHDNSVTKHDDEKDSDDDDVISLDFNNQSFTDEELEEPVNPNKLILSQHTRTQINQFENVLPINSAQYRFKPNIESCSSKDPTQKTPSKLVQTSSSFDRFNKEVTPDKVKTKFSNISPAVYKEILVLKAAFDHNVKRYFEEKPESTVSGTRTTYQEPNGQIFKIEEPAKSPDSMDHLESDVESSSETDLESSLGSDLESSLESESDYSSQSGIILTLPLHFSIPF